MRHPMRRRARLLTLTLALLVAAAPAADATWSIIIVDPRTKEIGIASATCLSPWDLKMLASVVRVGQGGAAAQSFVDFSGVNRQRIWNGFRAGTDPRQILALLAMNDPQHQTRQYGIVDTQGRAVGFTGTGAFAFAAHFTGTSGGLVYAIQGNILTGAPVLIQAELAILNTPGDLAEKLMAAMQAARAMGGDGRCSCRSAQPTSCGSPPANFTHSASIGYMVVARLGDTDGVCTGTTGCANGSYYLDLNVAFAQPSTPDPVLVLQGQFTQWRQSWTGRPDHVQSTVRLDRRVLGADGKSRALATIALRDWRGIPLTTGGARVTATLDPSSTGTATLGATIDNGNGTYAVPVTAGTTPGTVNLKIVVDDGKGPVQLSPLPSISLRANTLTANRGGIHASLGDTVVFTLDATTARANRSYFLAASVSGTFPGFTFGQVNVPLNPDLVFSATIRAANSAVLPGFAGTLDASGRATARLIAPPGALGSVVGLDLAFAYALLGPRDLASNPVYLRVEP